MLCYQTNGQCNTPFLVVVVFLSFVDFAVILVIWKNVVDTLGGWNSEMETISGQDIFGLHSKADTWQ
jgi:hypothetical protein